MSMFTVTKECILFIWDPEDFAIFYTVHFHIYCDKRKYIVQLRSRGFLIILMCPRLVWQKKVYCSSEIQGVSYIYHLYRSVFTVTKEVYCSTEIMRISYTFWHVHIFCGKKKVWCHNEIQSNFQNIFWHLATFDLHSQLRLRHKRKSAKISVKFQWSWRPLATTGQSRHNMTHEGSPQQW